MDDVDAIVLGQGPAGQAIGDGMLVARMDVSAFAHVDDYCLADVFDGVHGHSLGFS